MVIGSWAPFLEGEYTLATENLRRTRREGIPLFPPLPYSPSHSSPSRFISLLSSVSSDNEVYASRIIFWYQSHQNYLHVDSFGSRIPRNRCGYAAGRRARVGEVHHPESRGDEDSTGISHDATIRAQDNQVHGNILPGQRSRRGLPSTSCHRRTDDRPPLGRRQERSQTRGYGLRRLLRSQAVHGLGIRTR